MATAIKGGERMSKLFVLAHRAVVTLGVLCQLSVSCALASQADGAPHVLFVKVGTGIEDKKFEAAVPKACEQMRVKWRSERIAKITVKEIIVSVESQLARWGKNAVLVVYVADDPQLPGLLNLPGQCSLINLRTMRSDKPSEAVYDSRLQRLLMKGLAYAAGTGGNHDPRCVMYWKSFSVGEIDKTSSTFGPYAYFALQDILRSLGGSAIFSEGQ
jgi:hypothetical protein